MVDEFINQLNISQNLNSKTITHIKKIVEYFIDSSELLEKDLEYIKDSWSYSKIKHDFEFNNNYPMIQAVQNYDNGVDFLDLINLEYKTLKTITCSNFPRFNFESISLDEDDYFISEFHFKFQMTWFAYKWQQLNLNSIGYKAFIVVNGSCELFFLTDFQAENDTEYGDLKEYKIFENDNMKSNLTLWEIFKRVSNCV